MLGKWVAPSGIITPKQAVSTVGGLENKYRGKFKAKKTTIKILTGIMKQYDTEYTKYADEFNNEIGNKWIFTCKYGWVDLGHFFTTARWKAKRGWSSEKAYAQTIKIEKGQEFLLNNDRYKYIPGTDITDAQSAWTAEDLNSNYQGAYFEHGGAGNITKNFKDFLIDAGALNYEKSATNPVYNQLKEDAASLLNGDIYTGKRLKSKEGQLEYQKKIFDTFKCFCNGDMPIEGYGYGYE